ncbi:MAG: SH3 domain-containing protein [Muribaculaceae bacterium]|nr:SH3 domain-containing protein [Muribaculaceae bacterium]
MKSIIKKLGLRTLVAIIALTATTSMIAQQYVVVTGDYVRLHEGPSINSNFVRDSRGNKIYPPKGQKLKVLRSFAETWEVEYKNKIVYISKDYAKLLKSQTTTTTSRNTSTHWVQVTGTHVRLRTSPSLNGRIFTYSNGTPVYPEKGTKLKYLGTEGDFYKVDYNGYTLYISKQYSKLL